MELENIILNEISQAQGPKSWPHSFVDLHLKQMQ
jgi:hypothetical protein